MTLQVIPEGLAAASAAVEVIAARMAAVHAAAAPVISAVIPPAADPVSIQTSAGFSAAGMQHNAFAVQGVVELVKAATGLAESGTSYAVADIAGAATYGLGGLGAPR